MFENLGGGEMLLIFLVILIFFGPKKIPELATSLGKGLRKFRDAKEGLEDQLKTVMKEPVEALQAVKAQFDQHLTDAQKPMQETAQAFQNLGAPAPTPVPVSSTEAPIVQLPLPIPQPPPPINTLP